MVSSSACRAASLAWAKKHTALSYDTCSPRLPGWPLHLGQRWNSKDKKCCLYKMPYVAAPRRVLGDVITKTIPYTQLPLDAPARTRNFSWFTSDVFLRRPILSYWDSYVHFLWGGLRVKMLQEKTTYHAWRVLWQVPSSVSSRILCSDLASQAGTSGNPKFKMTARKGGWVISPDSQPSLPLRF